MEREIITMIRERFRLETESLLTQRKIKNLTEDIRMENYLLRERKVARIEYDGSLKKMLDALKGKKEQRIEELDRAVRQSEANLQSRKQQLDMEKQTLAELEKAISGIPDRKTLKEQAEGNPAAELEFAKRTAGFCAVQLESMLQTCMTALEEHRKIIRGERAGELMSQSERLGIMAKPEEIAEAIRPVLEELQEALVRQGEDLQIGVFFQSPSLFLNPAARHTKLDRASQAMDQVLNMQKTVKTLMANQDEE